MLRDLPSRIALLVLALGAFTASVGCVAVDPDTGQPIPRGKQKYLFATVKERVAGLEIGMPKLQVLMTLGSPAETAERGDLWIYLPERTAYVVPSQALEVRFEDDRLKEHRYTPLVFNKRI